MTDVCLEEVSMDRVLRAALGVMALLLATTNAWGQATAQINGNVASSARRSVSPGLLRRVQRTPVTTVPPGAT